jgi:hypothetical protein
MAYVLYCGADAGVCDVLCGKCLGVKHDSCRLHEAQSNLSATK